MGMEEFGLFIFSGYDLFFAKLSEVDERESIIKAEKRLSVDVCVLIVVSVCRCVLKDKVDYSTSDSHILGELD